MLTSIWIKFTAAGVYLPEGRHPIIPIFHHSFIPVVSAPNLSSLYRNFHFLFVCGTVEKDRGKQSWHRALTLERMKTNTTELRSIEGPRAAR
jgi:hypothetical protein